MTKYNVLIVDDEYAARETLKRLVDWEELGFAPPMCAQNGKQALALFAQSTFELVFTDIEMPICNGIDFIAAAKQLVPHQKFVIISCHERFDYACQAIRLGVNDYLIKDLITPIELKSLVCTLVAKDSQQRRAVREQDDLQACFEDALRAKPCPDSRRLEKSNAVFCIQPDSFFLLPEEKKKDIAALCTGLLRNIPHYASSWKDNRLYALIEVSDLFSMLNFLNGAVGIANQIRSNAKEWEITSVSIGISASISNLQALPDACVGAEQACRLRAIMGLNKTLFYNTVLPKRNLCNISGIENTLKLVQDLAQGSDFDALKYIGELFEKTLPDGFAQSNYYQYIAIKLWEGACAVLQANGETLLDFLQASGLCVQQNQLQESTAYSQQYKEMYLKLFAYLNRQNNDSIVAKTLRLIDREYKSDISLEYIANALHTHKSYLCRAFKEQVGENLQQYITAKKIDHAKYLLQSTQMRLGEISDQLSFASAQYFSSVFKKQTGVSPALYRKNAMMVPTQKTKKEM